MFPPHRSPDTKPRRVHHRTLYLARRVMKHSDQGPITQPMSDATLQALWGADLVEEVLTGIGGVPESQGAPSRLTQSGGADLGSPAL
jgi:hypothetical protein